MVLVFPGLPDTLARLFLPVIILSSELFPTFERPAKVLIVWGMMEAVGRFNGVLTSILANNGAVGAMRGIESMNRTADTRFSRYGGKYLPGTTDVDDPSGRGRKADKQREKDMEQRSYQQRNSGSGFAASGGVPSGGDSQKVNMAINAGMMAATGGASAGTPTGASPAAQNGNGIRTSGKDRNAMRFEEYQEKKKTFGAATQSQIEALFGSAGPGGNGSERKDNAPINHADTQRIGTPPKRAVPPPRQANPAGNNDRSDQ